MSSRNEIKDKFYYERTSPERHTVGDLHYHNLFEIYYLEEGTCHYFIDNETYDVRVGDIVLIPEGTIHKTVYRDSDAKRRLIYCSPLYIPTPVTDILQSMVYIYRNKRVVEKVVSLLDAIERECASPDDFSEDAILCHMHTLFFLLARNRDTETPQRRGNPYAAQTIAYIKEHYAEDITLCALAAQCAITPEHLSRVFRHSTGFGISEYITTVRLQQARALLRAERSLSVADVSARCGFSDGNYFSKRFKEVYGISPLHFRRS